MKKRIQSYIVFTSFVYRIVIYLAAPVILIGIALWTGSMARGAGMIIAAVLLSAVEVVSDQWLFGGIQTKDMEKLDYLKTSGRGMKVMKSALSLDLVRKFLSAALIMSICCLAELAAADGKAYGWYFQILFYSVAVSWFFSVLGTFISRFGSMLWFSVLLAYGMIILESICWGVFSASVLKYGYGWIYVLAFMVLGILVSMLAVKIAMNNVEGSYYDK